MANTLTVNNERRYLNPLPEIIDQAIGELTPERYFPVVLESDQPVDDCLYVQALIEYEGKFEGRYLIETRYKFADGFKHYRKHVGDAGEVKRIFRMFAKGVATNVAGWDDITERLPSLTK